MQVLGQWQDEEITVGDDITLHSVNERYVEPLYALIDANRTLLQQAMNWPMHVTDPEETRKTLQANYLLHHRGYAKMFMVFWREALVGVVSFNLIEPENKAAYFGYWLAGEARNNGIISQSIQAMMTHYTASKQVRRFVIKCIVSNEASNRVAQRNGFTLEGRLREAEYLNGKWHDQYLYARIVDYAALAPEGEREAATAALLPED